MMNKLPISTHKSAAQIFLEWRVFFLFFNLRWDFLDLQNMRLDLGEIQIIPLQREGTPHTTINEINTSSLWMTYIQKVDPVEYECLHIDHQIVGGNSRECEKTWLQHSLSILSMGRAHLNTHSSNLHFFKRFWPTSNGRKGLNDT